MLDPLTKFKTWWLAAIKDSPLNHKSAMCLSSINKSGFPNARFVDLKAVDKNGILFCSSFDSVKASEMLNNSKVSLTLWWDHIGYQVRILGHAKKNDGHEARIFWDNRKRSAQIATRAFRQSDELSDIGLLDKDFKEMQERLDGKEITKPTNWGAYRVIPHAIEFLQFQNNRLHVREQYQFCDDVWTRRLLQP